MIDRHYAPRTPLRVFASELLAEALATADDAARRGERVVILARAAGDHPLHPALHIMPSDPDAYARTLYATLHALDAEGASVALIEALPEGDAWEALRDRLRRASDAS
jgi:L-threonylcarbamoyladenylate synthase